MVKSNLKPVKNSSAQDIFIAQHSNANLGCGKADYFESTQVDRSIRNTSIAHFDTTTSIREAKGTVQPGGWHYQVAGKASIQQS